MCCSSTSVTGLNNNEYQISRGKVHDYPFHPCQLKELCACNWWIIWDWLTLFDFRFSHFWFVSHEVFKMALKLTAYITLQELNRIAGVDRTCDFVKVDSVLDITSSSYLLSTFVHLLVLSICCTWFKVSAFTCDVRVAGYDFYFSWRRIILVVCW
jgi:hypothetical protein